MANPIQYSSYDFTTIKNDLVSYLRSSTAFRDYNFEGANIITLTELIAAMGDLFNFYINAIANEYFIDTAELYKNLNRISKLISYNPGANKASTTTIAVCASLDLAQDDDYFEIPKYSTFSVTSTSPNGEVIKYITVSKTVFVGVSGAQVYDSTMFLVQGNLATEFFNGDGTAFQKVELSNVQGIEEYMEVYVNNELWTYVTNLYHGIDDTSKVYTTRYNQNKKVEVEFGNGTFGVVPSIGVSNIKVNYLESLGTDGRIGAGEITGLDDPVYIVNGQTGIPTTSAVTFTFSQSAASDGGRDALTETEIANLAPKHYRTQDRVVTKGDHSDRLTADFNAYVSRVQILNSDDYFAISGENPATSGKYYNNLYIYVLPRYGSSIPDNLKIQITDYLDQYKMTSINYIFKPIDFYNVATTITFKVNPSTTRTVSEITTAIEAYVRSYFSRNVRNFGDVIYYSEILSGIQAIDGVLSATLVLGGAYEDLILTDNQFPKLVDAETASASDSDSISAGTHTFNIQTSKSLAIGQPVVATATSGTMTGIVDSYIPSAGTMVMDAQSVTGSGSYSSWTFAFTASPKITYTP